MTFADAVTILGDRVGDWDQAADIVPGSDDFVRILRDAMRSGVRRAGYPVASAIAVTDSEVQSVADESQELMLDAAEIRVIETLMVRTAKNVENEIGPERRVAMQQASEALATVYRLRLASFKERYGSLNTSGTASSGSFGGAIFTDRRMPPSALDIPYPRRSRES